MTARTFFRHYGDKREVLFGGWSLLHGATTEALDGAPPDATPMELVRLALDASARWIEADPVRARRRQAIIDATPELQERELIKYDLLTADLAERLRRRGTDPVDAALAAHTGLAIYRVAFNHWITAESPGALIDVIAAVAQRHERLIGRTSGVDRLATRFESALRKGSAYGWRRQVLRRRTCSGPSRLRSRRRRIVTSKTAIVEASLRRHPGETNPRQPCAKRLNNLKLAVVNPHPRIRRAMRSGRSGESGGGIIGGVGPGSAASGIALGISGPFSSALSGAADG